MDWNLPGYEHLSVWSQQKPLGLFLVGAEGVRAVSACHDLLEQNRLKSGPIWNLPEPDESAWFSFYGSHRRLRRGLLEALGAGCEEAACLDAVLACLSWSSTADRSVVAARVQEEVADLDAATIRGMAQEFTQALLADANAIDNLDDLAAEREIVCHPAVVFFLQVAAPIWLRHGEWLWSMLRRATSATEPDLDAIDQLIRNDRRFRRHPLVERRRAWEGIEKAYRQRIQTASTRKPQKVRTGTLKLRLAGLISKLGLMLGTPVEAREIRKLFDAQSRVDLGTLKDFDLQPGAGTLRREVNRARKHWLRSLPACPELETLKSVRTLLAGAFYPFGHEQARTKI